MIWFDSFLFIGEGGVETDPIEAGRIFTELAEKGHPFAQVTGFQLSVKSHKID